MCWGLGPSGGLRNIPGMLHMSPNANCTARRGRRLRSQSAAAAKNIMVMVEMSVVVVAIAHDTLAPARIEHHAG